jgi:hypothetical protein
MNLMVSTLVILLFSLSQVLCASPAEASTVAGNAGDAVANTHQSHESGHGQSCDHDSDFCDLQITTIIQADKTVQAGNDPSPGKITLAEAPSATKPAHAYRLGEPTGHHWRSPAHNHTPVELKVRLLN